MLGNVYKKGSKRVRVEKQTSYDYFKCKEWFNGKIIVTSLTIYQLNSMEYICTL